jgi:hypothetical protein
MPILVQRRGLLCGQRRVRRLCAGRTKKRKRLSARCAPVDGYTRAPASKSPGKNSESISPQSLVNWLKGRSAEAGL